MTIKSNILIIGSTGRNRGKTEFACRVIGNHSGHREIIAVKVIPVDKKEENCHRGDEGCGLCNSLTGEYKIIEENNPDTAKDTSRMLKAGAKKVYLLIVDRDALGAGIKAILNISPANAMIVVESNSIRKVVDPGLFIVIKNVINNTVKESCAEVIQHADKIIEFDNMQWNFQPEKIIVQFGAWMIGE